MECVRGDLFCPGCPFSGAGGGGGGYWPIVACLGRAIPTGISATAVEGQQVGTEERTDLPVRTGPEGGNGPRDYRDISKGIGNCHLTAWALTVV